MRKYVFLQTYFFYFRVLMTAINKTGGQLERLLRQIQIIKHKDDIIEGNNEKMKQLATR